MFYKEWEVLIVDDEPDVLSISKLAMRNFEVYGLPLRIVTAASKAEAIAYLESRPNIRFGLALALIDVVMETDSAGLELCQHIRETMGNRLTQIYVRTGQPGIAPERAVIDRYDISGYFTKHEATEDKLYSLVKAGVRQFLWNGQSYGIVETFSSIMEGMGSRDEVWQQQIQLANAWRSGFGPTRLQDPPARMHLLVDGRRLARPGSEDTTAPALFARLEEAPAVPLGVQGDKYAHTDDNYHYIKITAQPNRVGIDCVFQTAFVPPLEIIELWHRGMVGMAIAWKWSQAESEPSVAAPAN